MATPSSLLDGASIRHSVFINTLTPYGLPCRERFNLLARKCKVISIKDTTQLVLITRYAIRLLYGWHLLSLSIRAS